MKDLNKVDTIQGIKVRKHSGGYALCQSHYIDKLLHEYRHLNIEEANGPYDSSIKVYANSDWAVAQLEYASIIDGLTYAMQCTGPNIAFIVCNLPDIHNPSVSHWKSICRIFGYLKEQSN